MTMRYCFVDIIYLALLALYPSAAEEATLQAVICVLDDTLLSPSDCCEHLQQQLQSVGPDPLGVVYQIFTLQSIREANTAMK